MIVDINKQIETLIDWIKESKNIVFFGGAGVSTESGIPDFRSKDGLYNKKDINFKNYEPEYLLSHGCLFNNPKVFYEFYRQKMDTRYIEPNITHQVLAKLEEVGKLSGIVTQNIDGLHQKAGSKKVYEIHGSALRSYCTNCKKKYDENFIFDNAEKIPTCPQCGGLVRPDITLYSEILPFKEVTNTNCKKKYDENFIFDNAEKIPTCPQCGGLVRPDITLYSEILPFKEVTNSIQAISNADMLIIGGTSLNVYPAATYVSEFNGGHIVVINKEEISNMKRILGFNDMEIVATLGDVFYEIENHMNEIEYSCGHIVVINKEEISNMKRILGFNDMEIVATLGDVFYEIENHMNEIEYSCLK